MNDAQKISKLARQEVGMLGTTFLLGMAVNLIGLPSETTGTSKTVTTVLVSLHGLIALGLIIGAIQIIRRTRKIGSAEAKLGLAGGAAIVVAIVAGMSTLSTKSNWWSYLMALSFIAAFFLYGRLLLRVTKA